MHTAALTHVAMEALTHMHGRVRTHSLTHTHTHTPHTDTDTHTTHCGRLGVPPPGPSPGPLSWLRWVQAGLQEGREHLQGVGRVPAPQVERPG